MEDRLKFTRRSAAKGLAASALVVAGFPGPLEGQAKSVHGSLKSIIQWQQVHPGIWRASIGSPEIFTPVSSRLVAPKVEALQYLPAVPPLPGPIGAITSRGTTVELLLRPGEEIYGLGLQFLSLDQRGKKKVTRVNADPKMDTGDSHAPVPFYVTTGGIGVLIDTARYASFYFGDARLKPTAVNSAVDSSNPDPNYTHDLQEGDPGHVVVEIPHAPGVDVYLFAGPAMLDAVRRYNMFSGGGPVPPEWGLGFWYRAESRATDQSALALIQEFRERKIPCDVLGLEAGWQTHAYSCTFVWEPKRFPDNAQFISSVHALDCKVNLWEHAFTNPASPLFPELHTDSGDYGVWGGLVPDFAGKDARDKFSDFHGRTLIDLGVNGFKLDECDNSDYTGGWSFPELSKFPSGVDGEQMHSIFGLLYQDAIWRAFQKRGESTYSLVRSSGALATPYPFVLYSDLYGHRDFIRALVNSGFSGLLWCPEVRDAVSVEDLIRRLQSVVFSPLAMINGWYIKNPPWKQLNRKLNNANQLMDGWEVVEERCREIIGWRIQLVPYFSAAFGRYADDGTPPFRALVLDHPEDKSLRKIDDQYMIGDRMMVAPLFAGENERTVVIPGGSDWHDFWTGAPLNGGTTVSVAASQDDIPVYVKTGSIIPWADVGPHAGTPESRRISARVYGDGSLTFEGRFGAEQIRLSWSRGHGTTSIEKNAYTVYAWKQIGE